MLLTYTENNAGSDAAGFFFFVFLIYAAIVVYWIWSIVDVVKRPDNEWRAAGQSKVLWLVLIILLGILGSVIYHVLIRRSLRNAANTVRATPSGMYASSGQQVSGYPSQPYPGPQHSGAQYSGAQYSNQPYQNQPYQAPYQAQSQAPYAPTYTSPDAWTQSPVTPPTPVGQPSWSQPYTPPTPPVSAEPTFGDGTPDSTV